MFKNDFFRGNSVQQNLYSRGLDKKVFFNVLPTWGTSRIRSLTQGTGANVTLDGGEFRLDSGTDGANDFSFKTQAHAQYRSGLWGDGGIAIRFDGLPTGNQEVRWGLFNDRNGFGWGYDANGYFVFRRSKGSETIYRPNEWSVDPLDGSGKSDLALDPTVGYVYRILLRWYGHGPVVWGAEFKGDSNFLELDAHRQTYSGEILTEDPNQKLNIEIKNNGTTGNDFSVYVGGRQYALWGRDISFEKRLVAVPVRGISISASNTWENLFVVRKKGEFPVAGRENSVRVVLRSIAAKAVDDYEIRVSRDATTDAAYGSTPEDVAASETAIEVNPAKDFNVTTAGLPLGPHVIGGGSKGSSANFIAEESGRVQMGSEEEIVVQGRSTANGATIDIIVLELEEQW